MDPVDPKVKGVEAVFAGVEAVTHLLDLGMYFQILPSPADSVGLSGILNGLLGGGGISDIPKFPTHADFNVDGGRGISPLEEEDRESDFVMVRRLVNYAISV